MYIINILLMYCHDIKKVANILRCMKKRVLLLFVVGMTFMFVHAQTLQQQGFVKTLGRPDKPGEPLENVTIQMVGMVNPVKSDSIGEFHLSAFNKVDGDPIKLLKVRKNGYELRDQDLIGREMVFSSRVPIYITMVDTAQLTVDKKRIEDNARRVAEENYQKKRKQLEKENKENKLTAEKYRQELEALEEKYEKYLSLIGDMADRYARADYDYLDSIDVRINICIENGELEEADSLIHTIFDPETVLEKNRAAKEEIRRRIEFAQKVIEKANADKEAILKDMEYAWQIAAIAENIANEYIVQGEKQKAVYDLDKALAIYRILDGDDCEKVKELEKQIKSLQQ